MKLSSASRAAITVVITGAVLAPGALASIDVNMRGKGSITYTNDGNPVQRTRSFTGGVMGEYKHPNYANPLDNAAPNSGESWTNDNAFVNKAAKDRFKYPGAYNNMVPLGTLHPEGKDELQRIIQQAHTEGSARDEEMYARKRARDARPTPQPQTQQSRPTAQPQEDEYAYQVKNSKGQTEYEAMMERVNSGATTPRSTNTASSRCPTGTSYHKIKSGGLLFKKTVAEGCYTDFQASQLRMQADSNHRQKTRDFQRDIQEATKTRDPINCSGTVNSWGNGYATYNTNCY